MALVTRVFRSHDTALEAQKALGRQGLPANEIHVLAGRARPEPSQAETPAHEASPAATPAPDETMARLARLGLPADEAAAYARELDEGHAVVTVRPPFGAAQAAINTLHEFDPIPLAIHETRTAPPPESVRAAPLSARFGWRVLINDPEPLSRALGWKTLQPDPATAKASGQAPSEAAPLSDRIKLPVLLDSAAPLSAAARLPTLSGPAAPLSDTVKLKVLLDDPAPLSRQAGWGVLLDEPAPLSKKAGWRVLLDDPAPLSRLLGLPVLWKR